MEPRFKINEQFFYIDSTGDLRYGKVYKQDNRSIGDKRNFFYYFEGNEKEAIKEENIHKEIRFIIPKYLEFQKNRFRKTHDINNQSSVLVNDN